jgi:hypothetical protein
MVMTNQTTTAEIIGNNEKRINEILDIIWRKPGNSALNLRNTGLRPDDADIMKAMQKTDLIIFRDNGWWLTPIGDIRLMEVAK